MAVSEGRSEVGLTRAGSWAQTQPMLVDALLALILFLLSYPWQHDDIGWALPLLCLETIPLIWRRYLPVSVLIVVSVSFLLQSTMHVPLGDLSGGGLIIAMYSVAAHRRGAVSLPLVAAFGTGALVGSGYAEERPMSVKDVLLSVVLSGSVWLGGSYVRSRRVHAEQLEAKAAELERKLFEAAPEGGRVPQPVPLTPREVEVVKLVARGLSNAQIADELFVSETTVKTHVARVFTKLDLQNRAQVVALAYERGLVRPGGQTELRNHPSVGR